jgi:hypothetical protein
MHFLYLANVLLIHTYTCVRSKFTAGNKQCARATAATVIHVYKKERQNNCAHTHTHTRRTHVHLNGVLIDRFLEKRVIGRCLVIEAGRSMPIFCLINEAASASRAARHILLRALVWGVLIYKVLGMHAFRIS